MPENANSSPMVVAKATQTIFSPMTPATQNVSNVCMVVEEQMQRVKTAAAVANQFH